MKRKSDPRHLKRVAAVKKLFEISFRQKSKPKSHFLGEKSENRLVESIIAKQKDINSLIKDHAPAWPIEQIAPIDLAVLRLAIFELVFKKEKIPYKVIIDEAVEIAKEYGSISSASFINGVLGAIVKSDVQKVREV